MRAEKLDFEHQELLFARMKKLNVGLSDFSFANLYLFRQAHNPEVLFDEQEIFIRGKAYDGFTYLTPTRDIRDMDLDYLKGLMKNVDFLYPVPEEWLVKFTPGEFQQAYNDGDSDYIYTTEKISTYKGNKLHKKRNLLKQFMAAYAHQAYPLVKERLEDAIAVLDAWQKDAQEPPEQTDYYSCLEAVKMNEELLLCGIIYYADKEPAGFILGEELTEDMFVIKFAKAKKKFKGIYQYIYHNFAKLLPKKYQYFNFEEDLGKDALRIAKSSYSPDKRLRKYRVSLK